MTTISLTSVGTPFLMMSSLKTDILSAATGRAFVLYLLFSMNRFSLAARSFSSVPSFSFCSASVARM